MSRRAPWTIVKTERGFGIEELKGELLVDGFTSSADAGICVAELVSRFVALGREEAQRKIEKLLAKTQTGKPS